MRQTAMETIGPQLVVIQILTLRGADMVNFFAKNDKAFIT